MSSFGGEVVVITGAAGNIGSAAARLMADRGARVALLDIPALESNLEELVSEIRDAFHVEAHSFLCDVCNEQDVIKVAEEIVDKMGPMHMLFNNAGIQGAVLPLMDLSLQDFRNTMEVNVVGAFSMLQQIAKQMIKHKVPGRIVNVSSTAADGAANMIGYAASKSAIFGLTKSAAKDLAPYGIRVNSISPGHLGGFMWERKLELQAKLGTQYWPAEPAAVGDAMIKQVPMRRYGSCEEVVRTVAFLLSEESSFTTSENLRIAGGQ
eukprot:GEMP01087807.1.p1 GENE.GEMP01087807.1~~GEMP01087807.1.p1  ORF type:complete len:282 (+),score=57.35 GEMP01087807.1:54-848(+)